MNIKIRLIAIAIGLVIAMVASKNKSDRRRSNSNETASQRWERENNYTNPGDDPRFKAAEAEARRRWPEFLAAFNKREPNATYAVKAKFTDGDKIEWMWVQVESITGDVIKGTLDNDPVDVQNVKSGQKVNVAKKDVDDWIIARESGAQQGGFTVKVMLQMEAERKGRR